MTTARGRFSLAMAAAALAAGGGLLLYFHPFLPGGGAQAAVSPAVPEHYLPATLVPPAAVHVEAVVQALDVPLNAWVEKGQAIGETEDDGGPSPALAAQAQYRLDRAQDAVRAAREQLREQEPAAAPEPLGESAGQSYAEVERQRALEHNDDLYRRKLETGLQHDETVAAIRPNNLPLESGAPFALYESPRPSPRVALRRALERERIARQALLNLSRVPRIVAVLAPATGRLVERENAPGSFDVLTGLDQLTVIAHVGEKRAESLHKGQPAAVYLPGRPAEPLTATVVSVGGPLPGPAGAILYPVTLSAANPDGIRPAGSAVEAVFMKPAD